MVCATHLELFISALDVCDRLIWKFRLNESETIHVVKMMGEGKLEHLHFIETDEEKRAKSGQDVSLNSLYTPHALL